MEKITKAIDGDGHWYWIPNDLLDEFNIDNNRLLGLDYMDNPDAFDNFINKYEVYRTLGDPNNIPNIFK